MGHLFHRLGLPKAAVIKNSRFYFYCAGMYYLGNLGTIKNPIFYDPLPLYHSAGGIVGIGLMMVFGCTVVIRWVAVRRQY